MATPPDFSVGQVLTAAHMDAVGLWLVKTDSITSGSSKEITGVFSADFTNYKVVVSNFKTNIAFGLGLQLGTTSTSVYYYGGLVVDYATGATTAERGQGAQFFQVGAVGTTRSGHAIIDIFAPYQTIQTGYSCQGVDARTAGAGLRQYSGFVDNTTSYTSFTLTVGAVTFTSCDVAVYGYRN